MGETKKREPNITSETTYYLSYKDDTGLLINIARELGDELGVNYMLGGDDEEDEVRVYTYQSKHKCALEFIWDSLEGHREITLSAQKYNAPFKIEHKEKSMLKRIYDSYFRGA